MNRRRTIFNCIAIGMTMAFLLLMAGCTNGAGVTTDDVGEPGADAAEEIVIWGDIPGVDDTEDDIGAVCLVNEDCQGQFPDLGACEFALCDTVAHQCVLGLLKDYTPCDDADACTEATYCLAGTCGNGFTPASPMEPTCFEAVCDAAGGWNLAPADGPCDDGNPCTDNDMCAAGICAGLPTPACDCVADADCAPLDDGNACNGELLCLAGACAIDPASVVMCDHSMDTLCSVNTCDPDSGACAPQATAEGAPCDDGTTCTKDDTCQAGICVGGENVCTCEGPADCLDFEDGNLCNGTLQCAGGVCAVDPATVITCPATGNACVAAICEPASGICGGVDLPDGIPCDDGDPCTAPDACLGGACAGGPDVCTGPYCGDAVCDGDESCMNCVVDCGECPTVCGDNFCAETESCETCPGDCGACPPPCGDGDCADDEDCHICPLDCGLCPQDCGDGACGQGEDCLSCPGDCGPCPLECGDGICSEDETCASCPLDCGACEGDCCLPDGTPGCADAAITDCVCEADAFCCLVEWDDLCVAEVEDLGCGDCGGAVDCGDDLCAETESCETCPADCGPCPTDCGNGVCDDGEDCLGCSKDCGECSGDCCAANDTPGCADAVLSGCVCDHDPYCCQVEWDATCVGEVEEFGCGDCGVAPFCGDGVCMGGETCELCPEDCGACADGACCEPNGTPGCDNPEIMACVCAQDPYCCATAWDQLCANEVDDYGCGKCSVCGDGVCSGDEDAETCCGDCGNCTVNGCPEVCACDEFCCDAWDEICEAECAGTSCGNGVCEPCEDEISCPGDCGGGEPVCGDGVCNGDEDADTCCEDCGNCVAHGCADVCACDSFCCTDWDEWCEAECAGTSCGDGNCQACEDEVSCPDDCLVVDPFCGDGVCNADEDADTCCEDCGNCAQNGCPDICACDEFCCTSWDDWCEAECNGTSCGDGICQACETEVSCPADCLTIDPYCGDGICGGDEDGDNCCEDCGQCAAHGCPEVCACDDYCCTDWDDICEAECSGTSCGNDFCEPCEDEISCPGDCGGGVDPVCGDGICNGTEDGDTCCEDCGQCVVHGCPDVCACDEYCCTNWDDICELECSGTSCGNGVCEPCEDEVSCPGDCGGGVDPFCGDGICNGDEDGDTCCEDCGQCVTHGCPDVCECDAFCCTGWDDLCEAECNGTSCGNGYCEACEDELSCPDDCGGAVGFCGDGLCDGSEDAENCCEDCGTCATNGCPDVCECDPYCCTDWDEICEAECNGTSCGDGSCDPCEDEVSCPDDCGGGGPYCGDGLCDDTETCTDCPQDCGDCPPCDEPGFIQDCAGDCYSENWVGDGYCDDGSEPYFADFYCEAFDFDGGDCDGCVPDCAGKECGADGCGGSCGACAPGETCSVDGLCEGPPPSESCEGLCGEQAPSGCFCDAECFGMGDCCGDVCDFCAADYPADCGLPYCGDGACNNGETCEDCPGDCGECPVASCEGACGGQSDAGCWCDDFCFGNGDCCDDVCDFCGADYPADCGLPYCGDGVCNNGETCEDCPGDCGECPVASCEGACGGQSDAGCWCDDFCFGNGDCCDDVCDFCGADYPADCGLPYCGDGVCNNGETCEDCPGDCGACPVETCEGACGGQADAGCWCDEACFVAGDCCGDVCDFCGTDYPADCCVPDCTDKECGDDGCGGSCGTCADGETCNASGLCEVLPMSSCAGNCGVYEIGADCQCDSACFDFGDCCGDICGFCAVDYPEDCCVPDCTDKECGDDGCGGSCGTCADGETCNASGLCEVLPMSSCAGNCGVYEIGADCQCDSACFDFGDCCGDICGFCSADYPDSCF